jgi:L-amino acid N-acyltransferase
MVIRDLTDQDLTALLAIHNDAILTTTAIWDETPVDLGSRREWLHDRRRAGYPVLACEAEGVLLGYATFGEFRARSGYRLSVEHSVYVGREHQRRGVGRQLLRALIDRAQALGLHAMIGGIEAGNAGSISLHASMGFEICGTLPQVGIKFGRWLDLVFMQRLLDQAPAPPPA